MKRNLQPRLVKSTESHDAAHAASIDAQFKSTREALAERRFEANWLTAANEQRQKRNKDAKAEFNSLFKEVA